MRTLRPREVKFDIQRHTASAYVAQPGFKPGRSAVKAYVLVMRHRKGRSRQ